MKAPSAGFWDEWPAGLSLYAGAALAVGLFERFPPTIVAWFRVAAAGVVLLVVVRPARWEFTRRVGLVAGVFGCVTMGMNMVFYEAIAELPLGTAVAIEFMGPRSWLQHGEAGQYGIGLPCCWLGVGCC